MKLIFEKGAPGQHLTLMPACDVPEVELSNPRTPLWTRGIPIFSSSPAK